MHPLSRHEDLLRGIAHLEGLSIGSTPSSQPEESAPLMQLTEDLQHLARSLHISALVACSSDLPGEDHASVRFLDETESALAAALRRARARVHGADPDSRRPLALLESIEARLLRIRELLSA